MGIILSPRTWLDVLGTCASNADRRRIPKRSSIQKGRLGSWYLASSFSANGFFLLFHVLSRSHYGWCSNNDAGGRLHHEWIAGNSIPTWASERIILNRYDLLGLWGRGTLIEDRWLLKCSDYFSLLGEFRWVPQTWCGTYSRMWNLRCGEVWHA